MGGTQKINQSLANKFQSVLWKKWSLFPSPHLCHTPNCPQTWSIFVILSGWGRYSLKHWCSLGIYLIIPGASGDMFQWSSHLSFFLKVRQLLIQYLHLSRFSGSLAEELFSILNSKRIAKVLGCEIHHNMKRIALQRKRTSWVGRGLSISCFLGSGLSLLLDRIGYCLLSAPRHPVHVTLPACVTWFLLYLFLSSSKSPVTCSCLVCAWLLSDKYFCSKLLQILGRLLSFW